MILFIRLFGVLLYLFQTVKYIALLITTCRNDFVLLSAACHLITTAPITTLFTLKITSLLSVVSKVFEKLETVELVVTLRNVAFFLFSSMVLGLLDQLQIF